MNNKTKILNHLQPMRDMTLSFGCEVEISYEREPSIKEQYKLISVVCDTYKRPCELKLQHASQSWMCTTSCDGHWQDSLSSDYWDILGHPLTPMDLLRAVGNDEESHHMEESLYQDFIYLHWKSGGEGDVTTIKIPLTYRHLDNIPEEHEMWGQLCEVFNLKEA